MKTLIILIFFSISTVSFGQTGWYPLNSLIDSTMNYIYFLNRDTGFVLSGYTVHRTSNGGLTWDKTTDPIGGDEIVFIKDKSIGYAYGLSFVFQTLDHGITWTERPDIPPKSLSFPTSDIGYAVDDGSYNASDTAGVIFGKTMDGGKNWSIRRIKVLEDQYDHDVAYHGLHVKFYDVLNGYLHVELYLFDQRKWIQSLLQTTDGGESWFTDGYKSDWPSGGIHYLSRDTILFCEYSEMYKSVNGNRGDAPFYNVGGNTIPIRTDPPFYHLSSPEKSLFFIDPNNIYSSNGQAIIRSSTQGESWYMQYYFPDEFYIGTGKGRWPSIYMVDNSVGYFIGFTDSVYKTTDGGGPSPWLGVNNEDIFTNLYPNPVIDILSFSMQNNENILNIYDALGRLVRSESIARNTTTHRLNISDLPSGSYTIRSGNRVQRFVKY